MGPFIHILHLEDDPVDAELVQAKLEAADLTCQITRVQTRAEFDDALRQGGYDVILADFHLPMYDGISALRLAQELRPDVPFIFVSGVLGEDAAIEGLTEGATDYVLKQKLSRLTPAIKRALHEAENWRERKRTEEEMLQLSQELLILNDIAITLSRSAHSETLMQATLDKIVAIIPAEAGWIYLLDPGQPDQRLTLAAQWGLAQTMLKAAAISPVAGLMGQVLQEGRPVVAAQVSAAGCLGVEEPAGVIRSGCALIPLKSHDRTVGVLGIFNTSPHELTSREVSLLSAIGHQVGVVVENVQLTKEAAAVTLLREVDRLRSELIANVSHELRTPLGLIKIFATSLRRKNANFDPDTRDKFLQGIEEETTRLEEIVDNLLDLGRIEHERLGLNRRPADLVELARKTITALEPQLGAHRIEVDFPSGSLVAEVDPKRLEQVLRNLLSNAIKYSPLGSVIKVQGKREPGEVYLSVQDEGIGIPAEEQARIFERFYRVDNAMTRRTRGAGLGLAVCQGIVEAHGGQMGVKSSPDCGSTFWITLPVSRLRPKA